MTRNRSPPVLNQPPPPYYSGIREERETEPLLPQHSTPTESKKQTTNYTIIICVIFMVLLGIAPTVAKEYHKSDVCDPSTRNKIREEWNQELRDHEILRKTIMQERSEWYAERAERERIRRDEAKQEAERRRRELERKREEEERKRARIAWSPLQTSDLCERYGTRKYWARLTNVPDTLDPVKECQQLEVEIHGRKLKPSYCDDQGAWKGVWGNWYVDFDEGECITWWGEFKDKGCTTQGSGIRRIEAPLQNLRGREDHRVWNAVCSTTPADFNGLHFDGPSACADWGKYGIWGIWFINDLSCK